jgi:glyoxylase-like metal-dependent hydrolase (beta-lactamase superfamily II)
MRTVMALTLLFATSCAPLRALVADVYRVETWSRPSPPERRVVAGLESACTAGSINWIVPVEGGVVLVDAGFQESGEIIRAALKGRRVLAILITHAHIDHRSAAHQFAAPVYVGRADVALLENTYTYRTIATTLGAAIGVPPRPRTVIPVDDGFTLVVGGRTFQAISLPGHTPGSTAWHMGDILFSGDAVQSPHGDAIYPAPSSVTEDMRQAYDSLRKLRDVDFTTMLDAHYGRLDNPKRFLGAALARAASESTLYEHPSVRPAGCHEG